MVNKLFEHIGTKIVLSNPWLDTYSVNCIEIPFSNGEKRVVNLEEDEKEDLSISDIRGNGFYIKINPRFTYTEQRQLTSSGREFLVEIRFKFVFFSINAELEYSKLALENKFASSFRVLTFSDYAGNERGIRLNISQTNIDGLQIFKDEVGKDYDFGAESVFVALDGVLSFLSTDNYCDSECGLAVSESTLKTLDFCDPAIIALLNAKQRECLEEEFGGGGLTCEELSTCPVIQDIQQDITDEVAARETGDQNLQNQIDNLPTNTLAEVLSAGNKTNEEFIESNNGASTLHVHNDEYGWSFTHLNGFNSLYANALEFTQNRSSGAFFNSLQFTDDCSFLSFTDGAKTGYFKAEPTQSEIFHDDLIQLTAPSVKINSDEALAYKWYGDVNANSNGIINLRDAVAPQEPITKSQFDSYVSAVGQQRGSIDCSTNPNYPASNVGDRWEVTVAGKIGGVSGIDVQVYDEIVCKTQSVAGDQATVGMNFYVVQGNLERASETVSGYTQYATDSEVQAGTDNTKTFTPLKLENWWVNIKTLAQTFAAKITFTTAPRFNSTTASQRLEVDANKDLISVAKGTADNKNFGSTSGTVAEGNDIRFKSDDVLIREALGSTIKASTMPVDRVVTTYTLVDTRMDVQAIYIRESMTLTGVKWFQLVQGNYTADNYNGVGLYSYDGAGTLTLVASSTDDGNIWKGAANSMQSKAFSSTYNATPGVYFIALMYNNSSQTTAPTIGAASGLTNNNIQAVDFTNSAKFRANRGSLSSFPATQAMTGGSGLGLINSMLFLSVY